MNYVKSETYRLFRKAGLYWIIGVSLGLVVLAVAALYFSMKYTNQFPYGDNRFLYLNVLSVVPLIIFIGLLINRLLVGKEQKIIPQSVAYGISRKTIYLTKLGLTFLVFVVTCLLGIIIVFSGGELLLKAELIWRNQFFISLINLLPIVLGAFILGNALLMLFSNETITFLILMIIFSGTSNRIIGGSLSFINGSEKVTAYLPGNIIQTISDEFIQQQSVIHPGYWLVGLFLSVIGLYLGVTLFKKKDI